MSSLELDPVAQDLLFREARTAHSFTDERVTDETVRDIYDLVKYAPSSFNTQPLRVLLVRSAPARERLVRHMYDSNKAKTLRAPLVAVLAGDAEFHRELPRMYPAMPHLAQYVFGEREHRVRAAVQGASLQLGYFLLGVRAAGLAAGPMLGFDAEGVNQEFFPGGDLSAVGVVAIGKPAADAYLPRSPRHAYEAVFSTV